MLIDRKLKPLALTVAGTVLCDQAGQLIEEARCVVPKVRESAALKLPIVRIGLIDSAFPLLAPALGVELRLHADQLSILSGLTDAHRQGLLNRSLDISIATDAIEDVDGLERYPILEKPYILLLPRGWRDNGAIDLARFAAELPFIRYTERRAADRALSAAPAPQSRPARPMMQRRAWRRWSRRGSAGPRCASATCRRPRTRSDARRCRRRGSPAI